MAQYDSRTRTWWQSLWGLARTLLLIKGYRFLYLGHIINHIRTRKYYPKHHG